MTVTNETIATISTMLWPYWQNTLGLARALLTKKERLRGAAPVDYA